MHFLVKNILTYTVFFMAFFIPQLLHAEDRYIIIDDDVGFYYAGCFKDGYFDMYKDGNPALKPQWDFLVKAGRFCDTDGGVEIIYNLWKAETDPSIHIVGITTMQGTQHPEHTYKSAINILKHLNPKLKKSVPVYMGAPEAGRSFGKRTPAVDFIIKTVMENPGKVEILATGPLTNIATAIKLEPRIVSNWKQVYVASGNFTNELSQGYKYLGYDENVPEMNANMDVEAMKYFVKHAKNTTWFSGEATENHPWGLCLSDWMTIAKAGIKGNKFNAYAARQMFPWTVMINTYGRWSEWPKGCGHDSGTTASALMYYPELRGKSVVSGINMIINPAMKDGSYAQTLSNEPDRPKARIYYSVQGNWQKIHDQVMQAFRDFQ